MSESKADIGQEILKILEPGEYEKTNYLNRDGKRWVWLRYVNEQVESGYHQINLLCESVQKIAVKAGIMREDAAPNWAETLMLGDDILKQMAAKDERIANLEAEMKGLKDSLLMEAVHIGELEDLNAEVEKLEDRIEEQLGEIESFKMDDPHSELLELQERIDDLEAADEISRLFSDLTVKERDYERLLVEKRDATIWALRRNQS